MRKLLLLLLTALALSTAVGAAFTDVPEDHWAAEAVETAVARHVATGFPDGSFRPGAQVSRGQLLAMLLRGADPGGTARPGDGEDWWQPYLDAAAEQGLLTGAFSADADMAAPATRRELAALLVNADEAYNGLRLTEGWVETGLFTDEDALAAQAAATAGLLAGYPDGTFRGDSTVTRAEACTAVVRLLQRADWLGEGETQAAYTGRVLIKHTLKPDGGAALTSASLPEGDEIQTIPVPMDNFAGFDDLRRQDKAQWASLWGRTVAGADKSAIWGEIGYFTYTESGRMQRWTDRAVLSWLPDGEGLVAISHRPGRRPYFSGGGLSYRPCGDEVIRVGRDGAVEVLLDSRPAHGLHLTAITGVDADAVRVRGEEIWGMADCHAWEYAVAGGKLRPLVHQPGDGWSGFTPEAAAAEQARLQALGVGN